MKARELVMTYFASQAIHWAWSWPQDKPHLWLVDHNGEVPWSDENVRFCDLLSKIAEVDYIDDRALHDIVTKVYRDYFHQLVLIDQVISPDLRGGAEFGSSPRTRGA